MTDISGLADPERLTPWLDANIPELGNGPLKVTQLHGGTTNVILALERGGVEMVLRRPPAVPPPGSEKTVLREARVLTALNGTKVPHPHCYSSCADADVIGAPFYVMQRVEGWAAKLQDEKFHCPPPFDGPPSQYGLSFALVDGLVALANVDYKAVGLEGFGKPDNFLERQVDRWDSQIKSYAKLYGYAGRDIPGFDYIKDWLRANIPDDFRPGIIHGDMAVSNALFAFDRPARLNALIDWELSTIGDPMLDLAWIAKQLRDENRPGETNPDSLINIANFPTRQELARYYSAGTGRDLSSFDYFCVLGHYKNGCIIEYKVAQSAAGILPPETGRFFARLVLNSFAKAYELCRRAG